MPPQPPSNSDGIPRQWYWEAQAEVPTASAELWGDHCLAQGAAGAHWLEESEDWVRMVCYWVGEAPPPVDAWLESFRLEWPHAEPPVRFTTARKPVENWASQWRAHFRPVAVGRKLLVCPPWVLSEPDFNPEGRLPLVIDPGQGFGTGNHPTTWLALALLEQALTESAPNRLLDVGCGSGILAAGGCLLGAAQAVTVDIDPRVMEEVAANFRLNGLALPPLRVCGGPESLQGTFPLVLANITAPVLLALAPHLARLTAPGGRLILSGMLEGEAEEVAREFARLGFSPQGEPLHVREGWAALSLVHPST
ncbi:MAG: 50S ribosomal protein L11 methyltransferase [Deltaproteobacteria bacterium]|nr:50S ribosomal protein L11 methyltransferase [Deltaproteobacteria bacterium]